MPSFDVVTRQGLSISNLFWIELAISALLLALVVGLLITALVRFRASPDDAALPVQVEGNRRLEILWTGTPVLTLAVIFVLVILTMRTVDASQPGAEPLVVTGHQWWWEYTYPNRQVISANELHVPVGTPVQVTLQSVDVIHSLHVIQFGWMQDLVPGKTNNMSWLVDRPGVYDGTCNQYCGLQHAWMRVRVVAQPAAEFDAWATHEQQPVGPSGSAGEQLFLQNTCVSCHTIRGLASATGTVGPDLTHVGSRTTLGAGVLDNTVDNMRSWISNPQNVKPGVLMPPYQTLGATQIAALADYLESLK